MNWKPELEELARRQAFAREMGGIDKVKRQHDGGRLTIRERIDGLLDPASFHEIGALSGSADYGPAGELRTFTPANCVFGRGRIDERPVVVVGDDFTVRGGSADASIAAKPPPSSSFADASPNSFSQPIMFVSGTRTSVSVRFQVLKPWYPILSSS